MSAVVVSSLDKVGMRQLGLDGAIREESRKVVQSKAKQTGALLHLGLRLFLFFSRVCFV